MSDQVRFDSDESSDSIDQLLSSAFTEQAREKRMLIDAVHGAREALKKAEWELKQVRDLLTTRDETISELLLRVQTIEEWSHRMSDQIDRMPRDLTAAFASSEALEAKLREVTEELLADIREDQVEVVRALGRTFDSALADVRRHLAATREDYLDQLAAVADEVIEKNDSTAELMVEHLIGYLTQRDETMHKAREQMLIDLFQKLGNALNSRQGRKVAKAMGATAGARPAPPAPPPARKFRAPGARRHQATPAGPRPEPASPAGFPPEPYRPDRRREGRPPVQDQQPAGPIQLPTREFVERGPNPTSHPDEGFDPDLDVDLMSRDEISREYLIEPPPDPGRREGRAQGSRDRFDEADDFFTGPPGARPQLQKPGSEWIGGSSRDG